MYVHRVVDAVGTGDIHPVAVERRYCVLDAWVHTVGEVDLKHIGIHQLTLHLHISEVIAVEEMTVAYYGSAFFGFVEYQ